MSFFGTFWGQAISGLVLAIVLLLLYLHGARKQEKEERRKALEREGFSEESRMPVPTSQEIDTALEQMAVYNPDAAEALRKHRD